MKRYKIVDRYKFWENILIIILIGVLLFTNANSLNKDEYKIKTNTYILSEEQELFIKEWNGIPGELRVWMKDYEEEEFKLLDIPLSAELQEYIYKMSKKYDMDYLFVLSVMMTESSFRVNVKNENIGSHGYSISLMQLNNQYIKWYKELTDDSQFDIWDAKDNIHAGILVLKYYRDYWINKGIDNEELLFNFVLNSYNMGITGFNNYIASTGNISRNYDEKVLENKIYLEEIYY
jgi:soluble lytic murein transglycosylase-like protein